MNDQEYAARIYCLIFGVENDGGDAYTKGILDTLKTLTLYEETVLESRLRHGKTFVQIGKDMEGISKQRASNIFYKAILKLRHSSRRKHMSMRNYH